MSFKKFHQQFTHFDIQETIEFYSIFSGHPFLKFLKLNNDLSTCIQADIIDKIDELKPYFIYDKDIDFQKDLESILIQLAIGDRKSYTIYKKTNISQVRGRALYRSLFEKNIIKKERSREKPIRKFKGELIKKSLRKYKIQDKIHFCDNFTRFWFTFIAPYFYKPLDINKIMQNIEQYISLSFEELSNELIIHRYKKENIINYGSYWDKDIEIDLLIETKNGTMIAGESKWKNHKICKNILKTLEKKCIKAELGASKFVLCSKSGFSKELKTKRSSEIVLIELKDFEELF